jgi:hypothetical protein
MQYAESLYCHEKLKDRPELIESCGPFAARQRVRADAEHIDHDRVTWDGTVKVLALPPDLADDLVQRIIRVYVDGREDGKEEGRAELQDELRRLLRAAPER